MTAEHKKLTASDIYGLFQPEQCSIRVYLREKGVKESEPSPFDEVIKMLGNRHEKEHLHPKEAAKETEGVKLPLRCVPILDIGFLGVNHFGKGSEAQLGR